jgi:predicted RNA polymerase sigma factor
MQAPPECPFNRGAAYLQQILARLKPQNPETAALMLLMHFRNPRATSASI